GAVGRAGDQEAVGRAALVLDIIVVHLVDDDVLQALVEGREGQRTGLGEIPFRGQVFRGRGGRTQVRIAGAGAGQAHAVDGHRLRAAVGACRRGLADAFRQRGVRLQLVEV